MEAELQLARSRIEREEEEERKQQGRRDERETRECIEHKPHVRIVGARQKPTPLRRPKEETIERFNLIQQAEPELSNVKIEPAETIGDPFNTNKGFWLSANEIKTVQHIGNRTFYPENYQGNKENSEERWEDVYDKFYTHPKPRVPTRAPPAKRRSRTRRRTPAAATTGYQGHINSTSKADAAWLTSNGPTPNNFYENPRPLSPVYDLPLEHCHDNLQHQPPASGQGRRFSEPNVPLRHSPLKHRRPLSAQPSRYLNSDPTYNRPQALPWPPAYNAVQHCPPFGRYREIRSEAAPSSFNLNSTFGTSIHLLEIRVDRACNQVETLMREIRELKNEIAARQHTHQNYTSGW